MSGTDCFLFILTLFVKAGHSHNAISLYTRTLTPNGTSGIQNQSGNAGNPSGRNSASSTG